MNINVLNKEYQRIAVVDTFTSLMWCKRYYDVGALDLEIEASIENLKIFRKNYYITRDDDDNIYRIEAIEIDTNEDGEDVLIIGAVDCKCILSQRITWSQVFSRNVTAENFIRDIINASFINPDAPDRKINNFRIEIPSLTTETTTRQSTYDDIGEKVAEICRENQFGSRMSLDADNRFVFGLYKGVDRSASQSVNPRIIFASNRENLFTAKYIFDSSKYKNTALIGGSGEGVERIMASIETASGLDRREMFVDAGSVDAPKDDRPSYAKALIAEGKLKLAETANVESFEGEIDATSYRYKTDYDLGDIVTISNKYGISIDARIVEIIETWDDTGYTVEPVFEYLAEEDNLLEALLTEDGEVLMTEYSEALMYETSPIVTEDEQNYIITEDGEYIVLEKE